MKEIGNSSLWEEKFRPHNIDDVITTKFVGNALKKYVKEQELPNLLFEGGPGVGKTTIAFALAHTLDLDKLYINGSLENSVDVIRYKVEHFATTYSMMGGEKKKLVILDEFDRMTEAQKGLKAVIEQTESNCRYILCTNNLAKVWEPILSRCRHIPFRYNSAEAKEMMLKYFKRAQFVLNNEGIKYDKEALSKFIKKMFPDFRKILNRLQLFCDMYEEVTDNLLSMADENLLVDLIDHLKTGNMKEIRKGCSLIDSNTFYTDIYNMLDTVIESKKIPKVILVLGQYAHQHVLTVDPEINMVACCVDLINNEVFKK